MELAQLVREKRDSILRICQRHGVSRVRVFGSVVHGTAGLDSDLDLLLDRAQSPGGETLRTRWWPGGLVLELERLLDRKVDVVTEAGLHPLIRAAVLKEAREL
jgi:uncharacterized protein